jgi:trimeric autotransporter adhesin
VLSPGGNGAVTQSNKDTSSADASNSNSTSQTSDQDPTGNSTSQCGCGGAPSDIQVAKQSAGNAQIAGAASEATQIGAKNVNQPVRVLSHGDDGSVTQSNTVGSTADASNSNSTTQKSDQDQSGSGCGCSSDPIQVTEQSSRSLQGAFALSAAGQFGAKNDNSPVRVGSSGSGGTVDQSNHASSDASATNSNRTYQTADQDQSGSHSCGCGSGIGIQALGQKAFNGQAAVSGSTTTQDFGKSECGCSSSGNSNNPVRVWSYGNDGSVHQSNDASSTADSSNTNSTTQDADQSQSGSGIDIQALGQYAENGQFAAALSGTEQKSPSNSNGGDRVYSPGSAGSVTQSNNATSNANAHNSNRTSQRANQLQAGSSPCGCGGVKIQALGQKAGNHQAAFGLSSAIQIAPKNSNGGAAVWSFGTGGTVHQGNTASSTGMGANTNGLSQYVKQLQ